MGGMISAYKKLQTRSGSFMAFVTVEDLYGTIECVCFPKVYDKVKSFLATDKVVSLSGKISINDDKAPSIIVDRMVEFSDGEEKTVEEKPTTITASEMGFRADENFQKAERKPIPTQKADKDKKLWLNITGLEDADVEELMETLCYEDYAETINPHIIYKLEEEDILENRVFVLSAFPEFLLDYFGQKLWKTCVKRKTNLLEEGGTAYEYFCMR